MLLQREDPRLEGSPDRRVKRRGLRAGLRLPDAGRRARVRDRLVAEVPRVDGLDHGRRARAGLARRLRLGRAVRVRRGAVRDHRHDLPHARRRAELVGDLRDGRAAGDARVRELGHAAGRVHGPQAGQSEGRSGQAAVVTRCDRERLHAAGRSRGRPVRGLGDDADGGGRPGQARDRRRARPRRVPQAVAAMRARAPAPQHQHQPEREQTT